MLEPHRFNKRPRSAGAWQCGPQFSWQEGPGLMTLLCCLQWTECFTEGASPASPSAKVRRWAVEL